MEGFRPPGSFLAADFMSKYGLPNEDEDEDEVSLIYQHIGGMLERPPNYDAQSFGLFGRPLNAGISSRGANPG